MEGDKRATHPRGSAFSWSIMTPLPPGFHITIFLTSHFRLCTYTCLWWCLLRPYPEYRINLCFFSWSCSPYIEGHSRSTWHWQLQCKWISDSQSPCRTWPDCYQHCSNSRIDTKEHVSTHDPSSGSPCTMSSFNLGTKGTCTFPFPCLRRMITGQTTIFCSRVSTPLLTDHLGFLLQTGRTQRRFECMKPQDPRYWSSFD